MRGAIMQLGSPERCFTAHQRRAITLRDGGCLIPGCTVPAAWCEIHHVIPDESGGPTHPDNGVMLCWFHHRTIDTSGWQIRMLRGVPHIRPPAWLDPGGTWRVATKSPTRIADRLRRRRERVGGERRADERHADDACTTYRHTRHTRRAGHPRATRECRRAPPPSRPPDMTVRAPVAPDWQCWHARPSRRGRARARRACR